MSDFMKWLYANYIKPQIDGIPKGDYRADFEIAGDDINTEMQTCFGKTQEFTAVHAFLLGVRTGQGLAAAMEPKEL